MGCNTPGVGPTSPQQLAEGGQIRRLIASDAAYPTQPTPIEAAIRRGEIEHEIVPQGALIERIRAGGAGLAVFYTPTGPGTEVAERKEVREFGGRPHLLETALRADFALVRAARADRAGNLTYRGAGRNYNPILATAARVTVAELDEVVPIGALSPDEIVTPGVFVDRVVRSEDPLDAERIRALGPRFGKKWDLEVRERSVGPRGIPPDLMARKAAHLLGRGQTVNLWLGLPTLVSSFVEPEREITFHAENALLGFGPLAGRRRATWISTTRAASSSAFEPGIRPGPPPSGSRLCAALRVRSLFARPGDGGHGAAHLSGERRGAAWRSGS